MTAYESFYEKHHYWKETILLNGQTTIVITGKILEWPFKISFPKPDSDPVNLQRLELEFFLSLLACWVQDFLTLEGHS